jgi:two-component system sensor histidine kinase PilS (NtrC family)
VVTAATGLEQRLVVLMAARLALSLLSLGIALALDATGSHMSTTEWWGFYGAIAFAFVATIAYGLLLPRIRRQKRFAAINIATDIAIVSALVCFSGGSESVFTFLYVLVAVYGATLFERPGALVSASLGTLAYGAVLLAGLEGWVPGGRPLEAEPWPVLLTLWAVHASAVLLVAALSSFLSAELRRTGEVLRERTSDLHLLRNLHERTVESLMSGLLTVDRDGRVTSLNPEAERIAGLPAAAALGLDVEEVLPGVRRLLIPVTDAGRAIDSRSRMPYRNRRGEDLHLGVASYILKDQEGAPSGHVVIFQDVSEVVEMERELRRSERLAAVGQLSASIAHEIRNPLAAISGAIQMLNCAREGSSRADESRRLMEIATREAERLNHLITDFLQFARPEPANLQPVVVAAAVREVLDLFEAVRPTAVKVAIETEEGLTARADPTQLGQVLWNLVLNGSEAMPEGGTLAISAASLEGQVPQERSSDRRNEDEEKPQWAEIAVADEGTGIPADERERVFDPFFTTKRDGSGLGLAIVHRIVSQHGGSVRLESNVGSGTVIRLRLPRAEAPA